jgi:hypothetical protein
MLEVEEHRRTVEKTGSLTVVTTKTDFFSLSGRHTSLGIRIGNLLVASLKMLSTLVCILVLALQVICATGNF